ncbi:MarR family winged helix-turn-helix transcriptional regulator [Vibrio hippocampi]|uniref:Transcriptional regulator SlyA n=1 Tax=Vibrio hippocampi TaxID=654686 RepID=A0ABN8DKM9_9VIBR|nr:MarR family transcriptional regulator [Vibrio hippocampi]CAH0526766.1 Transcriptional regulator SlyA [Vibrio hippocampi]
MSIEANLEKLERLASKIWRTHAKEDPLAHLNFNEYDYLKAVQSWGEPIRLTDLAAQLNVSKPSATTMVQRLERKGLVARIPCVEDARSKRVILTDKALTSLSSETEIYGLLAKRLSHSLDSDEYAQLQQLLEKALG